MLNRRLVMFNDFVIIGPPDDPATIKGLPRRRCAEAHRRGQARSSPAATNQARTCSSRVSGSGRGCAQGAWYLEAGQGMGRPYIADDRRAYTLTDRGDLARAPGEPACRSWSRDEPLLNIYYVMPVDPANGPRERRRRQAFAAFGLAATGPGGDQRPYGVARFGQAAVLAGLARRGWSSRRIASGVDVLVTALVEGLGLLLTRRRRGLAVTCSRCGSRRRRRCSARCRNPTRQAPFPGRGFAVSLVNTGMGMPPVVAGCSSDRALA